MSNTEAWPGAERTKVEEETKGRRREAQVRRPQGRNSTGTEASGAWSMWEFG